MTRKEAVQHLKEWQNGDAHFTCVLYTLISKADVPNKYKLRLAFPMEFNVYESWYLSEDEEAWFAMELL